MPITTAISSQSYCEVQLLSWSKKKQDRTKDMLKMLPSEDDVETYRTTQLCFQTYMAYITDEVQTLLQFSLQSTEFVLKWVGNARYTKENYKHCQLRHI